MSFQNRKSNWSLWESLCGYTDVVLLLTTEFLCPEELIRMYSISRDFHFLVDSYRSKFIQASARRWAILRPGSLGRPSENNGIDANPFVTSSASQPNKFEMIYLFTFNLYSNLCETDATTNRRDSLPHNYVRKVASLRYLLFLEHRSNTLQSIIDQLALRGHYLPQSMPPVLAKLWLLMDIPTNKYRFALIHNTTYWKDDDLRLATLFFIKLDMAFQDPSSDEGRSVLRQLVLAQRSLSVLSGILKRKEACTSLELSRLFIRWKYRPRAEHQYMSILGVPPEEIGKLELEGWGLGDRAWGSKRSADVLEYLRIQPPASEGQSLLNRQPPASTSGVDASSTHTVTPEPDSQPSPGVAGRERQILLRPDQLVMREGILRHLKIDTLLIQMMRWGYIDHETCDNYPSPRLGITPKAGESSFDE